MFTLRWGLASLLGRRKLLQSEGKAPRGLNPISRAGEKGAEMVEFAFMLLPTLGLFFIIINVAWVIFARACLQEAVREGVRYAITGQTFSNTSFGLSVQEVTQQHSFGFIPQACQVTVQFFSPSPSSSGQLQTVTNPAGGDVVEVSVANIDVKPLAALLISSAAIPLSASETDIMQSPPQGVQIQPSQPCQP